MSQQREKIQKWFLLAWISIGVILVMTLALAALLLLGE